MGGEALAVTRRRTELITLPGTVSSQVRQGANYEWCGATQVVQMPIRTGCVVSLIWLDKGRTNSRK